MGVRGTTDPPLLISPFIRLIFVVRGMYVWLLFRDVNLTKVCMEVLVGFKLSIYPLLTAWNEGALRRRPVMP